MPSINEFFTQCSLIGIDHIEVIPDEEYQDTEPTTYAEVLTRKVISETTYNRYARRLAREDIVFFSRGTIGGGGTLSLRGKLIDSILEGKTSAEVAEFFTELRAGTLELEEDENGIVTIPVSNDMFIENALLFSESGGGAETTWAYETHTVNIPLNNGIRTFSGASKDEIVVQGLLGIVASDLKTKESEVYTSNSLYGKIDRKVKEAMKARYGNNSALWTLEDVKLPWLYNVMCIGYHPDINNSKRAYIQGTINDGQSDQYNEPFIDNPITMPTINDTYGDVIVLQNIKVENGQYFYRIRQYPGKLATDILSDNLGSPYELYTAKGINERAIQNRNRDYCGSVSFGGYNDTPFYKQRVSSGYEHTHIREQVYGEQPFLIGMVMMITDIFPNETYPYARFWLTPIAFDVRGNIIEPLVSENPVYEDGNYVYNESGYVMNPPFNNLDGAIIVRLALNMTADEAKYAQNQSYVIVPTLMIPDGYISDP